MVSQGGFLSMKVLFLCNFSDAKSQIINYNRIVNLYEALPPESPFAKRSFL